MVYGYGINDMQRGWAKENEWNKMVYRKWQSMLKRCYSEKYHKVNPTYINCSVCDSWLLLSNFINDFPKIDGYDKELFLTGKLVLDKDIKSNGKNKKYCLENCILVTAAENARQSNKTMDYFHINGLRSIKIAQYDKKTNELIKIWNGAREIERELRISNGSIITCCKWYDCGEDLEEWYKAHKNHPHKTAGGFIFKYAIEEK